MATSSETNVPPIPPSTLCRFCRRAIGASDAYCRHCGKRQAPASDWLYRPVTLIILGFAVLGPLAIPLVWLSPHLGRKGKTILTAGIVIATILAILLTWQVVALALQRWDEISRELELM